MSREAMKQALEFIDANADGADERDIALALRQALDTEQEPVAWISEGGDVSRSKRYMDEMGFKCNPLYTSPPKREWVGLTAPEVQECYDLNPARFASRIEAKLKEKNT